MKINKFKSIAGASFLSIAPFGAAGLIASGYVSAVDYCDPSATDINSAVCMQDINDSIIESMTVDKQYQLVDVRDGQTYYVVRLQDGNVWMSQNLGLSLNENVPLTSETSDLNDNINAAYQEGYSLEDGIIKWKPTSTTIEFTGVTVSGWERSGTAPYSAIKSDAPETGHESYGIYYNWSSSIASNNSASFSESTLDDITKNPQNSICPKRWRLPTISNQSAEEEGSTNEFARLNQLYNNGSSDTDEGLIAAPLYLVRAGYIRFGLHSGDIAGLYWSDTVENPETAFSMKFHSSTVAPEDVPTTAYKSYGLSVRCVARTGYTADRSDSDGEEDSSVAVPDTGSNTEASGFGNGSVSIISCIISGITTSLGLFSLHRRFKEKRDK